MGQSLLALSFALILPGLALCIRPPANGIGKWFDYGVLGFLGSIAFAFVPQFYWPTADWRIQAVNDFGIDLPKVLSVHPWMSFEAASLVIAGICWFYVSSGWALNARGRKYLYFTVSLAMATFAAFVVWGHYYSVRLFMFNDRAQLGSLLSLGGVVSFGYAIEGLRLRSLMHAFGLICSLLCAIALVMSGSIIGLYAYVAGVILWYCIRCRSKALPISFRASFLIVILASCLWLFGSEESRERVVGNIAVSAERLSVYADSMQMFLDAPILGHGIHTFDSVFPQYRDQSRSADRIENAQSEVFSLLAELGVVGFVCMLMILFCYFKRCRDLSLGRIGSLRIIALVAVITFLLLSLLEVSWHQPVTIYFVLLLAAFALPARKSTCATLRPSFWRFIGACLIVFGLAWGVAGVTSAPFHSSTAILHLEKNASEHAEAVDYGSAIDSLDQLLAWNPTLWRVYFKRAEYGLALKADVSMVDKDFKRARFMEPTLGAFCVAEGFAWLPRYVDRAVMAWEQALLRELEDKVQTYESMLQAGLEDRRLMDAMLVLSNINTQYRTIAFGYFEAELFNQEFEKDLSADPGLKQFTPQQRFKLIENWLKYGDLDTVAAFLDAHGDDVVYGWWLQSLLMKERTHFVEAVKVAREGLAAPQLSDESFEPSELTRIAREFKVSPDVVKGTRLLSVYLKSDNLERALEVTDAILEADNVPINIYYWRGEILYQMGEVTESWYAFRDYVLKTHSFDFKAIEE